MSTRKNGSIIIPNECIKLISCVMDEKNYDEDIELLINSSRELVVTQQLLKEMLFPNLSVKADIINSMACSSLEPLSLILNKNNEQCKECGNTIFSITKKIKAMCSRYFGASISKYIGDEIYKNRSVFLHLGQPESSQCSRGGFCPQINMKTKMVMKPNSAVNYNIFDFSSFLFRNIARDYFGGKL